MTVDTLSIAKDLKAAELPSEQAEAIAAAIGRSISEGSAIKADLRLLGQELRADIAQLRAELKAEIADVRSELGQLRAEMRANVEQLRAEMERMRNQLLLGFISSQVALAGVIIAVIKL